MPLTLALVQVLHRSLPLQIHNLVQHHSLDQGCVGGDGDDDVAGTSMVHEQWLHNCGPDKLYAESAALT
jgi:hypothetical protein